MPTESTPRVDSPSRKRLWIPVALTAGVAAVAFTGVTLLSGGGSERFGPLTQTLASPDGSITMRAPEGFEVRRLSADDPNHLSATTGNSEELASATRYDLVEQQRRGIENHAEDSLELFTKDLTDVSVLGPRRLDISGYEAIQYDVRGEAYGTRRGWVHTLYFTPDYEIRVSLATLIERFDEAKPTFYEMSRSVRVRTP